MGSILTSRQTSPGLRCRQCARVAILGAGQSWIGVFCKAVMRQHWVEDVDISAAPDQSIPPLIVLWNG